MPISLSALRAHLVADAHAQPLPTPQLLDLAADVIPYGSIVRFEANVDADEPVLSPEYEVFGASGGFGYMYPQGATSIFCADVRLPWVRPRREPEELPVPPRFPIAGWPPFAGGDYTLRLRLPTVMSAAQGEPPPMVEFPFRLGKAPAPGGAAPKIVRLQSGLPDGSVLVGQPWLATATVEDADNDVLGVIFATVRGGMVVGRGILWDDGGFGDEQARDGIYSLLRVGGDLSDSAQIGGAEDVTVTLFAQAVDLRGNWSEPASLDYRVRYSEPPLWAGEPAPDGPNIVEVGYGRAEGKPDYPRIWARCDDPGARVCVRRIAHPDHLRAIFDDGRGADLVAGDGIHSTPGWVSLNRHWDIVFYAAPKVGALKIGRRMALTIPPIA